MKILHAFFASVLALTAPLLMAQTAAPAASPVAKPAEAAKPVLKKRAPLARSAAKAVEEMTPIDDDTGVTLSPEDIEIAKRVYVGMIPCELGAAVTITANEKRPGFFLVQTKNVKFRMHPVESRTGAIRLEDPRAGAMWLQLGNKSMLMSQKLGQRLADECMSPAQITFADELKNNPPVSILEPAPVAKQAATAK